MADIILHRRSFTTGSVPTTESLGVGQFAINVPDGKVFIHKSSSVSQSIVSVVTTDSITTGSITLTQTASAALFIGTFTGSFSGVSTNAETASYLESLSKIQQVSDTTTTASYGEILVKSGSRWISSTSLTGSYELTGSLTTTGSSIIIGSQTITGSVGITGSFDIIGNQVLSGSLHLNQSASVSGTNIFGTASHADTALTASYVESRINREWHVSSGSGNDTTGDGSILKPFKTLGKASSSLSDSGERIILHPGTYPESITFSQLNFTIATPGTAQAGDVYVNGTLTFTGGSSSNRLSGFTIQGLVQSGNGNLYLNNISVNATTTKSGNGYFEAQNSAISEASGIAISNAGTCVFQGCKVGSITETSLTAVVSLLNCMTVFRPVVNAGTLVIESCFVYSLASGSAAVSASAASAVFLVNSSMNNTAGAPERVILGGQFGLDDVIMNRQNSTFGTSLATRAHFQQIQADGITGSFTGSFAGTVTSAETASFANSGFIINSSSLYSFGRTSSFVGVNSFSVPTGSSRGSILNYTVASASNARAGQVMSIWSGTTASYSETQTTDIGNTSGVSFTSSISGVNSLYTFGTSTAGWNVKFTVTQI